MVRSLCFFIVLSLSAQLHAAVRAWVDKSDIDETQSITLTIESQGTTQGNDPPDWSVLEMDFRTYGQGSNEILNVVNGKVRSKISFSIQLQPKRIGSITIPSFEVGGEKTDPITIIVRALDAEIKQQLRENVFFETDIDSRRQYVQAAVHVTRKLYYTNNVLVRRDIPLPTDIENALVVIVGEIERTYAFRAERNYNVLVQRFVLFPERSGEMVIPPTDVPVRVALDTRDLSLAVSSSQETLEILPIPSEFPADQDWFPAREVRISDSLAVADLQQLHAGDTIIREVTISATDAHSTGIPEIDLPVPDAIRQYPTTPRLEDSALIARIVGKRTQSESLLLTEPGEYSVPDTPIYWWNTETDELVQTVIGGRNLVVAPDPLAGSTFDETSGMSTDAEQQDGNFLAISSVPEWWLNVVIGLGWSLALIFGYLYISQRIKQPRAAPSTASIDYKFIRSRLASGDAREVKSGMVEWLTLHLKISQTTALRLLESNDSTRAIINRLNHSLYARNLSKFESDRKEIESSLTKIVQYQENKRDSSSTFLKMYESMNSAPS
ncbi:MAG: BatD family protein [Gammaproteobacteria bacterium]|nr:BatD family protein [Gammaproteobacteria bacterium]